MSDQNIQLPPIIVHSLNIQHVNEAITQLFKMDCIKKCSFEENNMAHITFLPMPISVCIDFYKKLISPIIIEYKKEKFRIESQYYTNI